MSNSGSHINHIMEHDSDRNTAAEASNPNKTESHDHAQVKVATQIASGDRERDSNAIGAEQVNANEEKSQTEIMGATEVISGESGEEQPVQEPDCQDLPAESYPQGLGAMNTANTKPHENQTTTSLQGGNVKAFEPHHDHTPEEASNQGGAESQHVDAGVVPPPLPHIPSSETDSIATVSSISNPTLEVDADFDNGFSDVDSAISQMRENSTNSVRSSIYEFVEENGRTYHRYKEGKYILPNDEIEQDRLDLQHQMLKIMLDGKLLLAPIKPNLQSVLDIGTGTGIWAIEFASKYPSANVIGTDLSPIQPEFIPPNCQFEVDDAEDEWMFTEPFDFVHMRGMMTCFRSPRDIITKAYNALRPGGYLEAVESIFPMFCHDDTLEGTALDTFGKGCVEAGKAMGREWTNGVHYKRWMEEIGFEDVKEKIFQIPTSPWPKGKKQKELGMWWQADLLDALGGTITVFTRGLGWERAEIECLLVDVRKDIKNRGVHAFMPIHVVYGRRPKETHGSETANNVP